MPAVASPDRVEAGEIVPSFTALDSGGFVARVLRDCTLGQGESAFRRGLARHVGKLVFVPEIKRYREKRTQQQCKTTMGVWMPLILEELGYHRHDLDRVYNWIKLQCWYEEKIIRGRKARMVRETHEDDTEKYAEFMKAFRGFVEDPDNGLGILLPDPDPYLAKI